MKKRRRLKKTVLIIPIFIILIILVYFLVMNHLKKINSFDYKFSKLGYTEKEIEIINKLSKKEKEIILEKKYSKLIPKFIKEDYFIFSNLDEYLKYYIEHKSEEKKHIVAMVNVNANYNNYTHTSKADISKGNLILVNKYNYLTKNFKIDDLVDVSIIYKYGEQKVKKEAYEAFKEMHKAAKKENLTLIINSSFRTFEYQEKLWKNYANANGDDYADSYAARAGYSEHQTGLALDIITYGATGETFKNTDEYKWLIKNAHKYGFILRYPEDKEDITGYNYESWHYRYVGIDIAKKIYSLGITFDEYYAYYLK